MYKQRDITKLKIETSIHVCYLNLATTTPATEFGIQFATKHAWLKQKFTIEYGTGYLKVLIGIFQFQVIFPTGVKVDIVRNFWGLDITILTNRRIDMKNESGTCLY